MAGGESEAGGFDIICELHQTSFGQRSAEERKDILDAERPHISVNLSKPDGTKYNRAGHVCCCQPNQRHGPKQALPI